MKANAGYSTKNFIELSNNGNNKLTLYQRLNLQVTHKLVLSTFRKQGNP